MLPEVSDTSQSAGRLCVVHLVRAANGGGPLRAFADALRRHDAGVDHELVLAMKGFESLSEAEPYLEELADLHPRTLFFPDAGLDIGVYLAAATCLQGARYCFLNSYSLPLVDDWLAKLSAALDDPGVGLVGATGSWASTRSWVAYSLGLPSAYRGVLASPKSVREQLRAMEGGERSAVRVESHSVRAGLHSARASVPARARALRQIPGLECFPAYHLRTNAFVVSHATLRRLRLSTIRGKVDAYALENGRQSITRQVQRMGLRTIVVDRMGTLYDHERWHLSRTFWQGDQEGLLVADNRTFAYQRGDPELRRSLSGLAWG